MATLKFLLRKSKQKANGEIPIYLRITENRKSRFLSTGISVKLKDWNERIQRVRKSHPNHVKINDELDRLFNEAQAVALDLKADTRATLSAKAVKQELTGQKVGDFFSYADKHIENLDAEGRFWEWKKARVLVSKLRDFHSEADLSFDEIDKTFLVRFEKYMREKLGNKTRTIGKNLQNFKRIMTDAVNDGLLPFADNPFLYYKIKSEKSKKDKLSLEEIMALENLDLPLRCALWHTRNYFFFSFYCAGIRFGDLCRLEWNNVINGRLEYRMAKTGTLKSMKLVPQAQAILDDYRGKDTKPDHFIFPLLDNKRDYSDPRYIRRQISSKNAMVNKNLKKLAELAEVKVNLSFHTARHSFADFARRQGMDLYSISKALGHTHLKTTEIYLNSFDEDAVDSAMDKLFGE